MNSATVFIGIGSNLGNRLYNIRRARQCIDKLDSTCIKKKSSLEETDPVDITCQPRFINQVVMTETLLDPMELLAELQKIELQLGRVRDILKGPRTIDLDILLYENEIINSSDLTVPHPEIKNRKFIVKHLLEIDPCLIEPGSGTAYRKVLDESLEKHQ